jgi:hypothetical protein
MQLQCIEVAMKTTSLPPLRVSPALRKAAEEVLEEGETLSSLVLAAVTRDIEIRKQERDFIARGLASSRKAKQTGKYIAADVMLDGLRKQLATARKQTSKTNKR